MIARVNRAGSAARLSRASLMRGVSLLPLAAVALVASPVDANAQAVNLGGSQPRMSTPHVRNFDRAVPAGVQRQSPGNNIVADGQTATKIWVNGRYTTITTSTFSGGNAFNSFKTFSEAQGNTVNLIVPNSAGKLVNIVRQGSVNILGTLNSYQNGKIGGNVVFVDSYGMVVGASGSVNVGSLTVVTPTQATVNAMIAGGKVNDALVARVVTGDVPLSADGSVVISGRVNASQFIKITATDVRIAGSLQAAQRMAEQKARFAATVNTHGMQGSGMLVSHNGNVSIGGGSVGGGAVRTSSMRQAGAISIKAAKSVEITGSLKAAGSAGRNGGKIEITSGGDIAIGKTANLTVSGAGIASNAGTIMVKATENLTVADGAAFGARGGTSGDGGFIELSAGKTETLGRIAVDLGATAGQVGTLLLDPLDLVVGAVDHNYASFTPNITTSGNIILLADNSITLAADAVLDTTSGPGSVSITAPHITMLGGSIITAGGDVTLTSPATATNAASVIIGDTSGSRATITGHNLTINAIAAGSDSASATVLITNADLTLTGNLDVAATATVNKSVNFVGAVASTNVLAAVDVLNGAVLTIGGHATLSASASTTVDASGAPNSASTKVTDAAAAVVDATSIARVHIGDDAVVDVLHGALKLEADNTVATTSKADASSSQRAGTSVAVSLLTVDTSAVVDGSARIAAGSLDLSATSHVTANTLANAAAEGAGEAGSGSTGGQYLSDAKYSDYEKTSDGGIKAAGALAIADVTSTTLARMASSNTATITGATALKSITENSSIVVADGSSATGSNGVGVAVGVGVSRISNKSLLEQKIDTAALTLSATMAGTAADNNFSVTATSGAASSGVGVAGAVATNLLDSESWARFGSQGANLSGGALSVTAAELSTASAVAGAAGAGIPGAKVGIGASVALNLVATRSTAELADGAKLTSAGDVMLKASGIHNVVTEAEQGAAGGVAVTPVLATTIVSDRTTASIGALTGGLTATGDIGVEATQLSTALTQASGAVAGDKAAVGAALAIAVLDEQTIATTSSSLKTDGAVSFSAKGASLAATTAIASASGGNGTDDAGNSTDKDGSVDDKVQKQTTGSSQRMAAAGIGDTKQQGAVASGGSSASGKSSTSEGGVAVAAAIAVDVSLVKVQAFVPVSVGVEAGGALTVKAVSNVDAKTSADGSTGPGLGSGSGSSKVGVGAAVAINVISADNRAELGVAASPTNDGQVANVTAGQYGASALTVSALKTDLGLDSPLAWNSADLPEAPSATTALGRVDQFVAYAKSGASGAKVSVAGSLAVNVLTSKSIADIDSGALVTITPANGGAVVLASDHEAYVAASALPSLLGASGENVGVGASVALNTALTTSEASLMQGAGISGAKSLSVKADSHLDSDAIAQAGAKGGTALDAVVAFTILSETTKASIESGALLSVADALEVSATSNGEHSALASGSSTSSGSGGTAIGGAAALITGTGLFNLVSNQGGPVTSETIASIARNVSAGGALSVEASGTHNYSAAATATASGGSELDKGSEGGSNSTSSKTLGSAPAGDSMKQEQNGLSDNKGGSSGGKLSVAAAVGATIIGDSVKAGLDDALTIHAGSVSVKATSTDQVQSLGNAASVSTQQDNGIGVGAALTIIGNTTKASIGNAAHIVSDGAIAVDATSGMNDGLGGFTAEAMSGASGKKLAVAGALAIGVSNSTTSATIGDNLQVDIAGDASTRAGALSVTAVNTSALASKAWSGSYSGGGTGVGASIAAAISNDRYTASIGNAAEINAASVEVSATNERVDDIFSTINALAKPAAGILADVNASLTAQVNNAKDLVTHVNDANNASDAVSSFKSNFAQQITADKNKILDTLRSAGTLGRDLPLLGSNNFYTEVVAGSASTDKLAVSGGLALQVMLERTAATIGTGARIDATNAVSVAAHDNAISRTLVGALAGSGGQNAAGISLGIIVSSGAVDARIGAGSTISHSNGISVVAGADHSIDLFEVSAGLANANGIAGILAVVVSNADVNASTGVGSTLRSSGLVDVAAENNIKTLNLAGSIAIGGKNGLGGVLITTAIKNTAIATIDSSAASITTVDAGSVSVSAATDERVIDVGVAGAGAGETAISGVGTSLVQILTSQASIGNDAVITARTGDVSVTAADNTLLINIAGVIAVGGNNGVGGAAAYGQITDTVKAAVGDNVTIDATGDLVVTANAKEVISDAVVSGAAANNVAVAVALASSVVIDNVSATIGKRDKTDPHIRAGGVLVSAEDNTLVVDLAGSIGIAGGTGVGAGVDANVLTKTTTATIADGVIINSTGDVIVQAKSAEKVFSLVAGFAAGGDAGVAGSVGAYVLAGNTLATIAGGVDIQADGNVGVIANDANDLTRLVGSVGVAGTAGVGASIGVSVAVQNTKATIADTASVEGLGLNGTIGVTTGIGGAFSIYGGEALSVIPTLSSLSGTVGNDVNAITVADGLVEGGSLLVLQRKTTPVVEQVRGVAVAASATSAMRSMAVSGSGGGTAAVSISGDLPVVVSTTEATIGAGARINTSTTPSPGDNQSVTVAASSDLYHLGIAGSAAVGGTAGVGAGAETAIFTNNTLASIGLGADIKAARNVAVTARSSENFAGTSVSAAGGGTAGVAGGLTGFVSVSNTKAIIDSAADKITNVFAGGNVIVNADDQTRAVLTGGTIGIGVGAAGVGMGVGFAVVVKNTEATIGASAEVTGLGNGTNNDFTEYTGTDFTAKRSGRGVLVEANSGQSFAGFVGAGAGGLYAGVAGAVAAEVFVDQTRATIGQGAIINGSNGGNDSNQDVIVTARNSTVVSMVEGTIAGGLAGVGGAVDVAVIADATSAFIGDGVTINAARDVGVLALTNRQTSSTVASVAGGAAGVGAAISVLAIANGPNADQTAKMDSGGKSFNDDANRKLSDNTIDKTFLSSSTNANVRAASSQAQGYKTGLTLQKTLPTGIAPGNSATIGNATVDAGSNVSVRARDTVNALIADGAVAVGAGGGAGIGIAVIDVANTATITNGAHVTAGGVDVAALSDRTMNGAGFAATAVGVSAALISLTDVTSTKASINQSTINALGSVQVRAGNNEQIRIATTTLAAGAAGGLSLVVVKPNTEARIDASTINAATDADGSVAVTAVNIANIISGAAGVVAGGGGVGLTIVTELPTTTAMIGAGNTITSGLTTGTPTVGDVLVSATTQETLLSVGAGVALGEGLGGALTIIARDETTTAEIGSATVTATGNVGVIANSTGADDLAIGGGAVGGGVGIGGSLGVTVLNSTVKASIAANADVTALGLGSDLTYVKDYQTSFSAYGSSDTIKTANLAGVSGGSDLQAPVTTDDVSQIGSMLLLQKGTIGALTSTARGVVVNAAKAQSVRSVAVSGGVGGFLGVGLSGNVPVIVGTTSATIGNGAKINQRDTVSAGAFQSVIVAATNQTYALNIVGAVAGGGAAGIGASLSTAVVANNTSATIGDNALVSATNNVAVTALAGEDLAMVAAAGAAGGYAGIAGGLSLTSIDNSTSALIGKNAVVVADNNVIVAANDITRGATFAGSIVLSGGGAVGAAVSVGLINKQTTATIDTGARVSGLAEGTDTFAELTGAGATASRSGKGVLVDAQSVESAYVFALGGGAGGFVAAAGAIGVNVFNTNTFATINSGAIINGMAGGSSQQDVTVTARDLAGISSTDYGVALASLASLAGGVDIGVLNTNVGASIGDAAINAGNDVLVNAIANKAINSTAVSAAASALALSAGVSVYSIGNGVDPNGKATAELKTSDASGGSVTNYAGTSLSVGDALGRLTTGTTTAANKKNSGSSVAASSASNASTTLNTRLGSIDVSGKMTAQNALVAGTSATIGSAQVIAAGAVKVNGNDQVTYTAKTGALSAGGVGVGAGIGIFSNNATTTASVTGTGSGGNIAANSISVAAYAGHTANLTSYAGSFALSAAVQADVALISDNSVTRAAVVNYEISETGGLTVTAASNRQLNATGSGVAAALGVGVGASITSASIGGSVSTILQDLDIGTSTVLAGAVTAQATSNDSANASSSAAAGGLGGAGSGAESTATVILPVTLTLNNDTIYSSNAVTLLAKATDSANASSRGVSVAGGISVGGSVATATLSPQVTIDVTGANIQATSLQSDAQAFSGGANASAVGASGALIGINATSATATDNSVAIATGTGGSIQTSGALNFNAKTIEANSAVANGDVVGFVAAGANVALSTTNRTTKATFVNMTKVAGGTVGLAAESVDNTTANSTSGTGGLIAGAAASVTTKSTNLTVAKISGASGSAPSVVTASNGMLSIAARHTENFSSSVKSSRAAVVGASGARLSDDISSAVWAGFGENVKAVAGQLTIEATNAVTRALAPSGWDVLAGSGGFLDASAAVAQTNVQVSTSAEIGKNTNVHLTMPGTGFGVATVTAANDVSVQERTKVDAGGAISIAKGEANVIVGATASVAFGEGSSLVVDIGSINAAAWSNVDVDARVAVSTNGEAGLIGAPDGSATANVAVNDLLAVYKNVRIEASSGVVAADGSAPTEGNISLYAGSDRKRNAAQALNVNTTLDLYNNSLIPIDAVPNAESNLSSNAIVSVAQSDAPVSGVPDTQRFGVNAAGDISLVAGQGLMSVNSNAKGTNIYLQGLSKVASSISEFFGGGPVSFDKTGGKATKTGSSVLMIDGIVDTGIARNKSLLITYDKTANCDPTTPACVITTGNINYVSGTFRAGGAILDRLGQIDELLKVYEKDTIAVAAYASERIFLEDKLVALGLAIIDTNGIFKLNSTAVVGAPASSSAKLAVLTDALNIFRTDVTTSIGSVLGDGLNNIALTWNGTNLAGAVDTTGAFLPYAVTTSVINALSNLEGLTNYSTVKGDIGIAGTSFRAKLADIDLQLGSGRTELGSARQSVADIKNLAAGIDTRVTQIVGYQQDVAQGTKSFAAVQTDLSASFNGITTNQSSIKDKNADFLTSVSAIKTAADAISSDLVAIQTAATPGSPTTSDNAINAALSRTDSNIVNTGAFTRIDNSRQYLETAIEGGALPSGTSITGLRTTIEDYAAKVATPASGKTIDAWKADLNAKAQDAASGVSGGVGKDSVFLQLANTGVQLGNIYLTAQSVQTRTGTGKILAPGDASINITNETAATLKIQNLNIPVGSGGRITVNNVDVSTGADITAVTGKLSGFAAGNVVASTGIGGGAQINIFSNYNPESTTYYDPDNTTNRYLNTLQISPDVILLSTGTINNPAGSVNIISQAGNVYINGKINAGSISIVARNGDLVTSYVNGFNHVGGDPATGYSTPGTAVTPTDPIATGLGLVANGQVFLAARYLNINSTVQSGIANWSLDLAPTTQLVTTDASRIGGLNAGAVAGLITTYREMTNKAGVPTTANLGNGVTLNLLTGEMTFSIATVQASIAAVQASMGTLEPVFTGSYKFVATDSKVDGVYKAQVGASYDSDNRQVVVDSTSVRGGYIKVLGQIINTNEGGGNLNVLDGFGTIKINNTTNVPVVLSTLNTGADASGIGRGTEGMIDITDVRIDRLDPKVVDATHTVFTRDYDFATNTGKVVVTQEQGILNEHTGVFEAVSGATLQTTASAKGDGDRTAVYNPMITQRYVYMTAADYEVTRNLSTTGSNPSVQQGVSTQTSSINMLSGSYVFIDYANILTQTIGGKPTYVVAPAGATLANTPEVNGSQTYSKDATQTQTGSSDNCSQLVACAASNKTVYYQETTEFREISKRSMKADYPINVNFIGSNTGNIEVTSGTNIILKGNVTNVAGTTTITAGAGASIIQGSASPTITAQSIKLTAGASIGSVNAGNVAWQPVKVSLTDLDGVRGRLDASAGNGVVAIKSDADLIIGEVTAKVLAPTDQSVVMLSAGTSISAAPTNSLIQADRVSLTALTGSIGSVADNKELTVNSGFTTDQSLRPFGDPATTPEAFYGLSASATGDINIHAKTWANNVNATILANSIVSTGGDVKLTTVGQLLDGNPSQQIDTRTYAQLVSYWESLGLIGAGSVARQGATIQAYEQSETQSYRQYWQIRLGQPNNGAAFDPNYQISYSRGTAQYQNLDAYYRNVETTKNLGVAPADIEARVAADIAKQAADDTARYRTLNSQVGSLTNSFDANYNYTASDTEKTNLTAGATWTEKTLGFPLSAGALKTVTNTNTVIKAPNISGRNVTILADGGIGETVVSNGALGIKIDPTDNPVQVLTDAQKVALATAERSDLELTINGVVLPNNATPAQVAAYQAAVAAGIANTSTTIRLGVDESKMSPTELAALNAAAAGIANRGSGTYLSVLSKRPLNVAGSESLNVTVTKPVLSNSNDQGKAFIASRGDLKLGDISVTGETRIKAIGSLINAANSSIQTGNIILEAATGSIGSVAPLVLNLLPAATMTARALNLVNLSAEAGNVNGSIDAYIDTIYSPNPVKVHAEGSILNANNDMQVNVLGGKIELIADDGSIGTVLNSLNVGTSPGGYINASARNDLINLYGVGGLDFTIGSALAGTATKLVAAVNGMIDGPVTAGTDITMSAGGRWTMTASTNVISAAGQIQLSADVLKMLRGARMSANLGSVRIDTAHDALVTGISAGSGAINAIEVTSGGHILAGGDPARLYDLSAMAPDAGIKLTATLGIGDQTWVDRFAKDQVGSAPGSADLITGIANPLRIQSAKADLRTIQQSSAFVDARIEQWLKLTSPLANIWADNRTPRPVLGYDAQLFQPSKQFNLYQSGARTTTNAYVVQYGERAEIIANGNSTRSGGSLVRDIDRIMTPTGIGSVLLRDDSPDLNGPFFHGDAFFHFVNSLRDRKVRAPLKGRAVNLKGLAFAVTIGD